MSNDNTDREALAKVIEDHANSYEGADLPTAYHGYADAILAVLPSLGWVKADDGNMLERWADYFEHVGSHVGDPQHLDGPAIARMLRCPPPFGAAAPDTTKEPTP